MQIAGLSHKLTRAKIAVAFICLLLLCLPGLVQAAPAPVSFPQPLGLVNDFANVIDDASEQAIWQEAAALWEGKGIELAVVTVTNTEPLDLNTYAYRLFQEWGIGDKDTDRGLLVLFSVEDSKIRIEVGFGLEGDINDAKAGRILDKALPEFRNHQYGAGLLTISKELKVALTGVEGQGKSLWSQVPEVSGAAVFGGGYLLLIIFAIIFRQYWLLHLLIRLPLALMRSGGRGGRGGGGGGFGGFGGGSSGGGGASRGF